MTRPALIAALIGGRPEIIEQAAQAALDAGRAHLGMRPARLVDQVPQSAECWRVEARAALEAVAPLIAARAWDEGFAMSELAWRHIYDGHDCAEGEMCPTCCQPNPYRADQTENAAPKKHTYRTDIDYAPDGTAWSWTVAECECDRPWRHA